MLLTAASDTFSNVCVFIEHRTKFCVHIPFSGSFTVHSKFREEYELSDASLYTANLRNHINDCFGCIPRQKLAFSTCARFSDGTWKGKWRRSFHFETKTLPCGRVYVLKLNFVFYYLVFKLRNYLSIRHFEKSGTVDIFHENPEPPDNLE